jgi:hypothetical protein
VDVEGVEGVEASLPSVLSEVEKWRRRRKRRAAASSSTWLVVELVRIKRALAGDWASAVEGEMAGALGVAWRDEEVDEAGSAAGRG